MDFRWIPGDDGEAELVGFSYDQGYSTPPLEITDPYRLSFDRNLAHAHEELAKHKFEEDRKIFTTELTWRENWFLQAENARRRGQPYRYLKPWPLPMREQCVPHLKLLDWYLRIEKQVGEQVNYRLRELRQRVRTEREQEELALLSDLEEKRKQDELSAYDHQVLALVLDRMEQRLDEAIENEKRAGQSKDIVIDLTDSGVVTELPTHVHNAILGYDSLWSRFKLLQSREQHAFPYRKISDKRLSNSPPSGGRGNKKRDKSRLPLRLKIITKVADEPN